MAKLYISEYAAVGMAWSGAAPAMKAPAVATQTVAIGGASAQSAAFNANTRFIRVHADIICSVTIDTDPTATADDMRFAADQTEYFGVNPGEKVAVISNT